MAYIGSPMLFLPPRPPVQVSPDRSLIIGRSRSCDLRIPSSDASALAALTGIPAFLWGVLWVAASTWVIVAVLHRLAFHQR